MDWNLVNKRREEKEAENYQIAVFNRLLAKWVSIFAIRS